MMIFAISSKNNKQKVGVWINASFLFPVLRGIPLMLWLGELAATGVARHRGGTGMLLTQTCSGKKLQNLLKLGESVAAELHARASLY